MDLASLLAPGVSANQSLVVRDEHTAPHVGSGVAPVLATPVLVNLFAATPRGMRVEAVAVVTAVEGRSVRFSLTARDEVEDIGRGTHERVVVSLERFDERVQAKARGRGT